MYVGLKTGRFYSAVGTVVLTAFLLSSDSFARPALPQGTPFAFGSSWNVATACAGAAVDSGLVGGILNPAALVSNRNELLGEGEVFGNISTSLGIKAADYRIDAGAIGYLNRYRKVTLAFVYTPLERLESGYTYGASRLVQSSQHSELAAIVAFPLSSRISAGLQVGNLRGTSNDGVLTNPADGDTSLAPHLLDLRVGARFNGDSWSGSFAMLAPPFGSVGIDRPVNVTARRTSSTYSYRGAWASSFGIGYRRRTVVWALDATVRDSRFRRFGGDELPGGGVQFDLAGSFRWAVSNPLRLTAGVSARLVDPEQEKHLIFGFGGSYDPTPDITLIGGAGLMFGTGEGLSGTALEHVRPWILRGGAIFHGD